MLNEILKNIRNYFPDSAKQISGQFEITEGVISPFPVIASGQYFLVEGSAVNDGVYNANSDFTDESFEGAITPLKIPKELIALDAEIEEYKENVKASPYTSESFGGYSYTRATNSRGAAASWQDAFATRLNAWRKL